MKHTPSGGGAHPKAAGARRLDALWAGIGRQLRCPAGVRGRIMGHLMSLANAAPNRLAIDALDVRPKDDILELGFGPGHAVERLAERAFRGSVTGIDQSRDMLRQASRRNRKAIRQGRVRLLRGDFGNLPFPDASFDGIIAVNVAYFFSPDGEDIREARRVLRPGGRLVIYVTDKASMTKWKFAGPESHRLYDEPALRALLKTGGFAPENIEVRKLRLPFGITGLVAIARTI